MKRPKVGLALGSGGAKGFAHVGVLKVLEEANIPIDAMAGSSMGALTAALYGAGHDVASLMKMATTFKRKYYLDFIVPKMGFIAGNKVSELLKVITFNKRVEDLSPKVRIVAADLLAGERVVFKEGSAAEAVRASISIPGIMVPAKVNERLLVDGGVVDRVPISIVRDMGADVVIASDVTFSKKPVHIRSIFDVIMQSIDMMQREMVKLHEISADVMIKPSLAQYHSGTFEKVEEMIRIGEEETRKHLPEIHQVIEQWKE